MKQSPSIIAICLVFSLTVFGCATSEPINQEGSNGVHPSESAILWVQHSAEYEALCYQAYNAATKYLDDIQKGFIDNVVTDNDSKAIIMDLDETVLDNSPYNARLIQEGKEYDPNSWEEWVNLEKAELIPGAKEFVDFAYSNGYKVYFISNRDQGLLKPTLRNLQAKGIDANEENLLLREAGNSKLDRRRRLQSMNIVMLVGDNMADFHEVFEEDLGYEQRKKALNDAHSESFGSKFIILPNPLYGDWIKSIEEVQKKREDRLQLLRTY